MKHYAIGLSTLLLLCVAPRVGGHDSDFLLNSLNGNWQIAQMEYTPNDVTNPVADQLHALGKSVAFKSGQLVSQDPGNTKAFTVVVGVSANGYTMDLTPTDNSSATLPALFSISDTTLTLIVGTGGNRPDGTGTDDTQITVVLIQP